MPLPSRVAAAVFHWVATNTHNQPCPTRNGQTSIDAHNTNTTEDDREAETETEPSDEVQLDFRKKKKKPKKPRALQPVEGETGASNGIPPADSSEGIDLEAPKEFQSSAREMHDAAASGCEPYALDGSADAPPYSYTYLLSRLHESLRQEHPSHPSLRSEKKRSHVPPPTLAKVGGRRVAITNFGTICAALHRPAEHVKSFLVAELATTGAVDGAGETLTLLAALQAKQAEQLLKKYVQAYVQCAQCHDLGTELSKGKSRGVEVLKCSSCNAERLLDPIKAGFVALRRGERRAAKRDC